jgi:hypothetical protein
MFVNCPMLRRYIHQFGPMIWPAAMLVLYFMDATAGDSLCLFKAVGFNGCPGCGLGHAIHEALHGEWAASFSHHILGIPATLVLLFQSLKVSYTFIKTINYNGPKNAYDVTRTAA